MSPVHPRARGEHNARWTDRILSGGSSPRSRGTRDKMNIYTNSYRFIPALAGNTRGDSRRTRSRTVHPRARGEHCLEFMPQHANIGSSPRSRGTLRFTSVCGM